MPSIQPLIVPGKLDSLKAVRDYVMHASSAAGLDKVSANRLRLAVDEIVTNSIIYGYDEAGLHGDVHLGAVIDDDRLTLIVEDEGAPYDPTQHDIPDAVDLSQPLDTREIGGLGIYLAVSGTDELYYERVGSRNRNVFVVYRTSAEAES